MSFWDNVKKFAQPYADDDYDDYDEEDDYLDDYEEPAEAPAPRREKRRAAPAPAPVMEEEAPPVQRNEAPMGFWSELVAAVFRSSRKTGPRISDGIPSASWWRTPTERRPPRLPTRLRPTL